MARLCQRPFQFVVALCLFTLVLVPIGAASTATGSSASVFSTAAGTGPTLPPLPWDGVATGPTLPPLPWDGVATGPTLPPLPWDGIV